MKAFGGESTAVNVASCESGFKQFNSDGSVHRGEQNPRDVGIFMINEKYHLAASRRLGYDIYTLEGNIAYAKYVRDHEGWKPWNWSRIQDSVHHRGWAYGECD